MRLSEVRLIKNDRNGEPKRYQLAIGQGVTFIYGDSCDVGSNLFADLHLQLISGRDTFFGQSDNTSKSSLLQDARFSVESQAPNDDYWEFVLWDGERHYRLSTEQNAKDQVDYFTHTVIGDEGSYLGHQLDLPLFANRHASDVSKRESLVELRERLSRSRQVLYDASTGRGKLISTTEDYEICRRDLEVLNRNILPENQLMSLLDSEAKSIAELKKEDDALARDQRLTMLLERKSEYEELLDLRRELKEIEEREGRYGSRITALGHDITVHELSSLVQWRGNVAENNRNLLELQDSAKSRQEQKAKLEQERILLAHRMRKNRELKDSLLDEYEYLALKPEADREKLLHRDTAAEINIKRSTFPTSFHFCILASLLALASGLLLFSSVRAVGIILIVLAVLGLAATFIMRMVNNRGGPGPSDMTGVSGSSGKDELRSRISEIDHSLGLGLVELEGIERAIGELEREVAQDAIKIEDAERQLNRMNNDLLRTIKQYAGPCELHEVDDIIATLSKQRESSANYNEAIADILRRIADLKHGRSDEDMVREYESVCEQLYGGGPPDSLGGDSHLSHMKTLQLHYDPLRAKQISDQRVEIARLIDEKKVLVKETKERLVLSKESSVTAAGLNNRYAMLEKSMAELKNDYARLCKAIAWLDRTLETWFEIDDIMLTMAKAVRYLGRISGRRTGDTLPMMPIDETLVQRIRRPAFLEDSVVPFASPVSIDSDVFKQTSAEQNYLAFRLAWATQRFSTIPDGSPLLLMMPAFPSEYSHMEELVNTLEEWTLETGRQVVFFTTLNHVTDIARKRDMVVYRIG